MAYTKYSLTPANNNAAPPDGAPEGMLPSAVNDTMRDMMAQIRDCGDGIRGGTYTMTAPVITGGSISGATGSFSTLAASGVATFSAGTVSAPSITTTGDTNTGIFFPAADTIAFTEGGVESMRIDSAGNVGIGTTSTSQRFNVAGGRSRFQANSDLFSLQIEGASGAGQYYIGATNEASPSLVFSNVAGTERMRIDSAGNVGIGTTSPNFRLHLNTTTASAAQYLQITNGSTGSAAGDGMLVGVDASNEAIVWMQESAALKFATSNAERMRIDSSGNLLVGMTSILGNWGTKLQLSTNSGTTKWEVGPYSTATNFIISASISGGVYLNGTAAGSWTAVSDERFKTDFEPIVNAAQKVSSLRAVTGRLIDDETSTRKPYLIAQDVLAVLPEAVDTSNPDRLGLSYTDVIPLLVASIKEQQAMIETLTTRLNALEGK